VDPLPAELLSAGATVIATPLAGSAEFTVNTKVVGGGVPPPELPPPPHADISKLNSPAATTATLRMLIPLDFRRRALSHMEQLLARIHGNDFFSR
jgi:hypothetical protein